MFTSENDSRIVEDNAICSTKVKSCCQYSSHPTECISPDTRQINKVRNENICGSCGSCAPFGDSTNVSSSPNETETDEVTLLKSHKKRYESHFSHKSSDLFFKKKHRKSKKKHKHHRRKSGNYVKNSNESFTSTTEISTPKIEPIFVWIKQDETKIVQVLCEDYDRRNRIRLTRTAKGWRSIPLTESVEKRWHTLSAVTTSDNTTDTNLQNLQKDELVNINIPKLDVKNNLVDKQTDNFSNINDSLLSPSQNKVIESVTNMAENSDINNDISNCHRVHKLSETLDDAASLLSNNKIAVNNETKPSSHLSIECQNNFSHIFESSSYTHKMELLSPIDKSNLPNIINSIVDVDNDAFNSDDEDTEKDLRSIINKVQTDALFSNDEQTIGSEMEESTIPRFSNTESNNYNSSCNNYNSVLSSEFNSINKEPILNSNNSTLLNCENLNLSVDLNLSNNNISEPSNEIIDTEKNDCTAQKQNEITKQNLENHCDQLDDNITCKQSNILSQLNNKIEQLKCINNNNNLKNNIINVNESLNLLVDSDIQNEKSSTNLNDYNLHTSKIKSQENRKYNNISFDETIEFPNGMTVTKISNDRNKNENRIQNATAEQHKKNNSSLISFCNVVGCNTTITDINSKVIFHNNNASTDDLSSDIISIEDSFNNSNSNNNVDLNDFNIETECCCDKNNLNNDSFTNLKSIENNSFENSIIVLDNKIDSNVVPNTNLKTNFHNEPAKIKTEKIEYFDNKIPIEIPNSCSLSPIKTMQSESKILTSNSPVQKSEDIPVVLRLPLCQTLKTNKMSARRVLNIKKRCDDSKIIEPMHAHSCYEKNTFLHNELDKPLDLGSYKIKSDSELKDFSHASIINKEIKSCIDSRKRLHDDLLDEQKIKKSRLLDLLTSKVIANEEIGKEPLEELRIILSNPKYSVPDPLLVPKARLSALITSPGKEIPRLIAHRAQHLSYFSILTDPDVLVVSLSHLQSLLKKPINEEEILKYQKQTEEIRSRLRQECINNNYENMAVGNWNQCYWLPSFQPNDGISCEQMSPDLLSLLQYTPPPSIPTVCCRDNSVPNGYDYQPLFYRNDVPWQDYAYNQYPSMPTFDQYNNNLTDDCEFNKDGNCDMLCSQAVCNNYKCFEATPKPCETSLIKKCNTNNRRKPSHFLPAVSASIPYNPLSHYQYHRSNEQIATNNLLSYYSQPASTNFVDNAQDLKNKWYIQNLMKHSSDHLGALQQLETRIQAQTSLNDSKDLKPDQKNANMQASRTSGNSKDCKNESSVPSNPQVGKIKVRKHLIDPNQKPVLLNTDIHCSFGDLTGTSLDYNHGHLWNPFFDSHMERNQKKLQWTTPVKPNSK